MTDGIALEAIGLGKRYGLQWGLQDCSFELPVGRIAALVGPNGAGKSTLLRMAAGITRPSAGRVEVFGSSPQHQTVEVLRQVGYLDQDRPLYRSFRVDEMLSFGRRLNAAWDDGAARSYLHDLGIRPDAKVGKLSGGQQAQVALTMCLAKRPGLLLLDEPVAALDPVAREGLMHLLLRSVVEDGTTVLLSSHAVSDLATVCDHVIILSAARVHVADELDFVLASHRLLMAANDVAPALPSGVVVVAKRQSERETELLVRVEEPVTDPAWRVVEPTLEEIVVAYLRQQGPSETGLGRSFGVGRGRSAGDLDDMATPPFDLPRGDRSRGRVRDLAGDQRIDPAARVGGGGEPPLRTVATGIPLAARCFTYEDTYSASTHFNHIEVGACIVLPALFGLVLGAPLVATELQQSTNRLAWTQTITRTRWLVAKFGVGALVVAAPMAALIPLLWWWMEAAHRGTAIQPTNFDMAGIVIVAYALFAFALGAALGALIRRVGWAFAVSLPVLVLVRFGVRDFIRPTLVSPVYMAAAPNTQPSVSAWLQRSGFTSIGRLTPAPGQTWSSESIQIFQCQGYSGGTAKPQHSATYCEKALHLHFVTQFQPESHFWPLQIAESAIFIGLAGVLFGVTALAVRRWRT